jgi:murein DD-endopeptidase MepM/ murein hydrolase activator NlpD
LIFRLPQTIVIMPSIKAQFVTGAIAAWLLLALPVAAGPFPETPDAASPSKAAGVLAWNRPAAVDGAEASSISAPLAPASPATQPHRAISGSVAAEPSLSPLQLALARPFALPYQQSPEFTYPYGSQGDGRYVLHTGVDIMNPLGTPVLAVGDGQVVFAGSDALQAFGPRTGYYGNLVVIRLDGAPKTEPVYALFAHLSEVLVDAGQPVRAGDVIGLVGMTGIAIGPHLHLEVRQGQNSYESTRNPALWLSSLPGQGTLAGRITDESGRPVPDERLLVYQAERPDQVWRVVRSYLESPLVNTDDAAAENFALTDVPAGDYWIVAGRASATVRIPVTIRPGGLALVEVRVQRDE